ncbi:MAG: PilZ domain-containing protein [Desulfobacula sp.]|nr:PilZ domain-containing protein [Desulfobacula sp.]
MNNTRSIEFQDIKKDNSQQENVRRSFRVPVAPEDGMTVVINDNSYQVVDISLEGISIACENNTTFMVAQTFDNCEIKTPDSIIKNLTGRIVHFSCGSEAGWQNGIQWIDFDKETLLKISTLVASMKKKLLKTNSLENE